MTKQIRLIDKYTEHGVFKMMGFVSEICGMRTAEDVISDNTDLLASYYREYERSLKNDPDVLKEFLAQKLGEEFIAVMGRHSK